MKKCSLICAMLSVIMLSACQSTQSAYQSTYQDEVGFKPLTEKRVLTSDLELAYSLTNRAVPKDQLMMLAFEQKRQQHFLYAQNERQVLIKGPRITDKEEPKHSYAWRINDNNSKAIYGPR